MSSQTDIDELNCVEEILTGENNWDGGPINPYAPRGRPGKDGKHGRDGTDGRDGADGERGRPGTPGKDSTIPGKDGKDGANGAPGVSGSNLLKDMPAIPPSTMVNPNYPNVIEFVGSVGTYLSSARKILFDGRRTYRLSFDVKASIPGTKLILQLGYKDVKNASISAIPYAIPSREVPTTWETWRVDIGPKSGVVPPLVTAIIDPLLFANHSSGVTGGTQYFSNIQLVDITDIAAIGTKDVKDFGAIGDGIADDTTAVQNWLNNGGSVLRNVNCRITRQLTVSGTNRVLKCDNAKLIADTVDMVTILVTAPNTTFENFSIDGNNKASNGVRVTAPGAVFNNCTIEKFQSLTQGANCIYAITNGGITVTNCNLSNVYSKGDGITGNNIGAARAVVVTYTGGNATAPTVITNNRMQNIDGEEGDIIQLLFFSGESNMKFTSAYATISGNVLFNASRRYIKVQASDVVISDNTCDYIPGTLKMPLTHPATSIDIINSHNVTVKNNDIRTSPLCTSIGLNGEIGYPLEGIVVMNNTSAKPDNHPFGGIFMDHLKDAVITGNKFKGGTFAIAGQNIDGLLMTGNSHYGGDNNSYSYNLVGTVTNHVITDNVNFNTQRPNYLRTPNGGVVDRNTTLYKTP